MKNLFLYIGLLVFTLNLNAQSKIVKPQFQANYIAAKKLAKKQKFEFEADWLFIYSEKKRRAITENQKSFALSKNSLTINMPISFEEHKTILDFKSTISNYAINYDEENLRVTVSFTTQSKGVSYDFKLMILSTGKCHLVIELKDTSISYTGVVNH